MTSRSTFARWVCLLPMALVSCSASTDESPAPPNKPAPPETPEAVPLLLVDQAEQMLPKLIPVTGLHATIADLDGDGLIDIAQPTRDALLVYWNAGSKGFEAAAPAAVPALEEGHTKQVLAADFDRDGSADLLLLDDAVPPLRLLTHNAARSFEDAELDVPADIVPNHAIAADLDGDADLDVVVTLSGAASGTKPMALVLINDGKGKLSDQTSSRLAAPSLSAFGVAAGDIDGDGSVDLFFAGDSTGHRLLLNDGAGHFRDAAPDAIPAFDAPGGRVPTMGDLDGDGTLDVVVPSSTANQVLMNDGTGRLSDETPFVLGASPGTGRVAVVIDLDRDTRADVVIGGTATSVRVLRNDGAGRLFDYTGNMVPNGPSDSDAVSIDAADFDGDGDPDLFVSRTSLARPWLLMNWYPETVADADGDDVPDTIDNCPDEPNRDQANADGHHFSCSGGTDCKARTGCELALREGKSAYLFCTEEQTYEEARTFCRARGADLVIIEDAAENDFVAASGLPALWIGLSDLETEGTFLWGNGTAPTKTFWREGEPNDTGGVEDCGGMYTDGDAAGEWNDFDCSTVRAFVCEDEIDRGAADPGDACDVCPDVYDPDQADKDDDGTGDACEPEST